MLASRFPGTFEQYKPLEQYKPHQLISEDAGQLAHMSERRLCVCYEDEGFRDRQIGKISPMVRLHTL